MKPYRIYMEFVVAAEDMESAWDIEDQLINYADSQKMLFQGGSTHEMPLEDVIEGSPLDDHLKGTCPKCHGELLPDS